MTPQQFRRTLAELGLSRARAAKVLRISEREVYCWCSGAHPMPALTAAVLRLMREGRLAVDDLTPGIRK
jgi:hypothetical protein